MSVGPAIKCLAPRPWARRRLVCLPYAGGGPASYRSWADALPEDVELWAAQLAGHAGRLSEPLAADLSTVATETAAAIAALPRLPIVLFGHSMGAWIALECARELERLGLAPRAVVVSGRAAPGFGGHASFGDLPDDGFVAELTRRYDGMPPEVAGNPEIMEVFLPVLRADVRMLERFRARASPIAAPVHVLVGDRDPSTTDEGTAESWRAATTGAVEIHRFEGGHFFVTDQRDAIVRLVARLF